MNAVREQRIRVDLLEVDVTPLTAEQVAERVLRAARNSSGLTIGNLNLHGVYVFHTDPDFAEFTRGSDLVLVDGMPVAAAARLPSAYRVGSTDWLDALMPQADGLAILAIGGTPEASAGAQTHFRRAFPRVSWTGVNGFDSQEPDQQLRRLIANADIVLVGMGMPTQERWILRHQAILDGKVVANVGGCFDYYAGTQRLAPRWIGRWGLEWLYRLAANPRRLAHRYLVEPFKLAPVLVRVKRTRSRHP